MMKIRFEYPSWHDDARAARASGMSRAQVADKFGMAANQASKICSASWRQYLLMYRQSHRTRKGNSLTDYNADAYEFVPVAAKPPIERERERNATKRKQQPVAVAPEETMSKLRDFETVKVNQPGVRVGMNYRITCCKCGATEDIWSPKGLMPYEFVSKKFQQRGWIVGGSPRSDICPEHAKNLRSVKPPEAAPSALIPAYVEAFAKKEEPVMNATVPAAAIRERQATPLNTSTPLTKLFEKPEDMKPAEPAEMGKQEKRIIFAKLNDVYEDETVGYSADWTDAKVAADLGVPVAWVAEVRDESFGPEINADLRNKSFDELNSLGERINQTILLVEKKLEQTLALDDKVADALEKAEAAVNRLDELTGNLRTSDEQMKSVTDTFNEQVAEFRKMYASLNAKAFA